VTSNPEPPTSEKIKPARQTWREWLHAKLPTEGKLHGTFVHRVFGDRIFHADLWKFTRNGVAIGLAVGMFATLIPILGLHVFFAVVGAFILRGNVPCAVLVCFTVGNPLFLGPFAIYEYKFGQWLFEHFSPPRLPAEILVPAAHGMKRAMRMVVPLMAGGTIVAFIGGVITYFATHALWGFFTHTPALPPKLLDEKPPESLP
jgi:uncharacterized protein (DUF2062 family)